MECQSFDDGISESSIGCGLVGGSSFKFEEFEKSENCGIFGNHKSQPIEYDRFISNRPVGQDLASNFEKKEFIFTKKLFDCNNAANEQCSSQTCANDAKDIQLEQP